MAGLMRQSRGYWPHLAALGYVSVGYLAGLRLLLAEPVVLNLFGVLWLAHALVIAAYMIHECAHNTVFADARYNARLGEALSFLVGSAYGDYTDIRRKHMRHHIDHADVVAFDFRRLLQQHPVLLRTVQVLEAFWVPAVDLLMHALVVLLPFVRPERRHLRARVIGVLCVRTALFVTLALLSLKALALYVLAYLLFLHVMRFMDVHQHTYIVIESLGSERAAPPSAEQAGRDRAYEERNTFSNLISQRYPWLNLLTLNFGYHNAHHARPTTPWYALPRLHAELYGDASAQILPVSALLRAYARHRVARVLNDDSPDTPIPDASDYIGVVGVSFLTAH